MNLADPSHYLLSIMRGNLHYWMGYYYANEAVVTEWLQE
jgi:hypothetical protein